jgi:hypothetical protein
VNKLIAENELIPFSNENRIFRKSSCVQWTCDIFKLLSGHFSY